MTTLKVALCLTAMLTALPASAATLPASAKKATMDEFKALADGKAVTVEIYDIGVPVTATLTWNWKKKQITGSALVNGKDKIKVKTKLSFKDDKACADDKGKPNCHAIFIDGESFYEVNDDGSVHAMSTLKK